MRQPSLHKGMAEQLLHKVMHMHATHACQKEGAASKGSCGGSVLGCSAEHAALH